MRVCELSVCFSLLQVTLCRALVRLMSGNGTMLPSEQGPPKKKRAKPGSSSNRKLKGARVFIFRVLCVVLHHVHAHSACSTAVVVYVWASPVKIRDGTNSGDVRHFLTDCLRCVVCVSSSGAGPVAGAVTSLPAVHVPARQRVRIHVHHCSVQSMPNGEQWVCSA